MSKFKIILCTTFFILSLSFGMIFPQITKKECVFQSPIPENYNKSVKDYDGYNIPSGNSININSATASTLTVLPSIGPALAKRIVAYRKSNGNFTTIEELMNVPGISKKTFDKVKNLICVK